MEQKVTGVIPINFFKNSLLSIFNGELLNGGAFRLRAVGADQDGNPLRSKSYLFFLNGMYSMVALSHSSTRIRYEIYGYKFVFTKNKNKKGYYWEVSLTDDYTVYVNQDNPELRLSDRKPSDEAIILTKVKGGGVSQYIYVQ